MRVLIVGAHGQIGRRLITQMSSSAHHSQAMIRRADQARTLRDLGADDTVVADLEDDIQFALDGCDAVIFSAGAGGHTGPEKTDAVDRDGAIAVIDAALKAGVERFVMVSSMGADHPENGPHDLQHYLRAKHDADQYLRESGLRYTIVRPGTLTDEGATGKVDVAVHLGRSGSIAREDVAVVLLAVLEAPNTYGKHFDLLAGDTPVREAVAAI